MTVQESFDHLVETVRGYNPSANFVLIRSAFEFADKAHEGQLRKDNSPFVTHPLAVAQIVAEAGHIDLLVNNAGISYVGLLTDMTIKDFDRTMKSNIYSVFNSCNRVVPYMVRAHKGHIINVSSVWGCCGASCEVAYSASKGAVNSFSKALGKELAPSGIAVNAIAFGAVDTTMNGHLSPDERQMLEDEIPAGRMATPQEAAEFICRIAGCGNYLNGQVITFDGAWQ